MVTRIALSGLIAAAIFAAAGTASAYHDEEHRPTYQTGYTLNQGEWQIGLLSTDVGVHDRLTLGIDHLYYALPIFNAHARINLFRDGDWGLTISGSIYYFNVDLFWWASPEATRGWLVAWPLELRGSIPLTERFTLHPFAALSMSSGKVEQTDDAYGGAAAANNFQIGLTTEWRITRVFALNLRFRFAPWVDVSGAGGGTIQFDPATSVEVAASGELDTSEAEFAFSFVLAAHFSWSWFNLRIGGGWGNMNLPGLNFLFVQRSPIVELGVFARF
ncbi:MAG: hypothetical protein DRJ42_30470 [Deltaproteobacteria bacterium]|nr:MAG: hypothetical protein DRJ42_30470 [Deltaproteobacteria bacterium]